MKTHSVGICHIIKSRGASQMTLAQTYRIPVKIRHSSDLRYANWPHSQSEYEIFYFHGGKCNYLIGNKLYALQPGDLIIMDGMTLHCANVDKRYAYSRTVLHFESLMSKK